MALFIMLHKVQGGEEGGGEGVVLTYEFVDEILSVPDLS